MAPRAKKPSTPAAPRLGDIVRELTSEKGISVESIKQTIESSIKSAYKRTFGTSENCIVKFRDDMSDVSVFSRKTIVDGVYDPATEIELEDALKLSSECEVGDEIDIMIDPHDFARSAVTIGRQTAHQSLNESLTDNLFKEFKAKEGEIIYGYYQRERNGNLYIDLGKIEGILPKDKQNPREVYEKNERLKVFISNVDKDGKSGRLRVTLSRTAPELVRSILENEVPELADKTVSIHKIVRDAGYRTKIAVYTNKIDVDPVGACVGLKGTRIQNVIQELEGEKIDVLKYDEDPRVFIKNALSPAEVKQVIITDNTKREALAIVPDSQYSLAIGKGGQNVHLANRLCDWNIDVKTEEQCADLDLSELETRKAVEDVFADTANEAVTEVPAAAVETVVEEEVTSITQLPGINTDIASLIKDAGLDDIEECLNAIEDGRIRSIDGIEEDDVEELVKVINEVVEFKDEIVEVEAEEVEETEEAEYFCPECGSKITLGITHCPNCGIELAFEEE